MRRKSLWMAIGLLVLIAGSIGATLVALTRHVPAFYAQSAMAPGPQRKELSKKFEQGEMLHLISGIKNGGQDNAGNWRGNIYESQLNAYLQEEFLTSGKAKEWLPEGISEPRVVFEQNRIRLGFRYGTPPWSTIISINFKLWVAKQEPNVVVLELQGLHAGALPVSAQSLLEDISEALRRRGIQVSWFRHDGYPTAAIQFQSDQPHPTAQLRQIDLKAGALTILGQSSEPLGSMSIPH
jgi:hypothetical protein